MLCRCTSYIYLFSSSSFFFLTSFFHPASVLCTPSLLSFYLFDHGGTYYKWLLDIECVLYSNVVGYFDLINEWIYEWKYTLCNWWWFNWKIPYRFCSTAYADPRIVYNMMNLAKLLFNHLLPSSLYPPRRTPWGKAKGRRRKKRNQPKGIASRNYRDFFYF